MQNIFYGRSYLAEKNFSGEELYTFKVLKATACPPRIPKGP